MLLGREAGRRGDTTHEAARKGKRTSCKTTPEGSRLLTRDFQARLDPACIASGAKQWFLCASVSGARCAPAALQQASARPL